MDSAPARIASPAPLPRRLLALALTPLLLAFGALYGLGALLSVRELSAMSLPLAACVLAIGASAIVMAFSAVWLIARLYRDLRPLWLGGLAAVVCGFVLVAGTLAKIIPCAGPS